MSRHSMASWCIAAAMAMGVAGFVPAVSADEPATHPVAAPIPVEAHGDAGAKTHVATGPESTGHKTAAADAGEHADAHAGEAHADPGKKLTEFNPIPLIFTIAVFIVLVVILGLTAWKPILAGLRAREESIRNSIEAAAKAKADAERTTRELESKIAEAQRQAAVQLQQAKVDAQKLADSIKAQAEADSAALKDRTLRDIDAAKQQALSDINTRAADLGIAVARKILQREVRVDDQQRLVEESLAQLGTTKV